jgi:hypothetical protein
MSIGRCFGFEPINSNCWYFGLSCLKKGQLNYTPLESGINPL